MSSYGLTTTTSSSSPQSYSLSSSSSPSKSSSTPSPIASNYGNNAKSRTLSGTNNGNGASNSTNGSAASCSGGSAGSNGVTASYFWQWDLETVERWLRILPLPALEGDRKVSQQEHDQYISTLVHSISPLLSGNPEDKFLVVPSNVARGKSIQHTAGSIVSRLPLWNLVNGISPKEGGNEESLNNVQQEIKTYASCILRAISAQVEIDMMESTPARVVEILCPEVTQPEINAIRKRIYDTVILGRGTNSSATAQSLEEDETTTSSKPSTSILEQFQKCKFCGNNNQSNFALDKKNGDVICMECGTVSASSLMHEGSQFRKFEGEADRNHHGDCPNPLFSNAHNMSTTLGGINLTPSDRMVGGGQRTMETVLRNAHAFTEMNISQFHSNEKKTRIGYKDKQKKEAFSKMHHVGDALSLHEAVIQRSKELFSGFRDDRELVQQFKGVVAACICEAYHQLSLDGKRILKQRIVEDSDVNSSKVVLAKRAHWRNYLHKSTAASQEENGQEQIVSKDNTSFKAIASAVTSEGNSITPTAPSFETIHISSWDMSECRLFLLEASRKIAQIWCNNTDNKSPYPNKSQDELEGMLVEYTLIMCDYFEQQSKNTKNNDRSANKRAKLTPKAASMGNLSITWQNSDPVRSGMTCNSHKANNQNKSSANERKPGQTLLLLSPKKWNAIIKDNAAAEAFHRELKNMLAVQECDRSKKRRMEMAEQRFRRIKRKPWLQARAKIG